MPTLSFPTWRDVPEKAWRWQSFSPAEIACRGAGAIKINTEAMIGIAITIHARLDDWKRGQR